MDQAQCGGVLSLGPTMMGKLRRGQRDQVLSSLEGHVALVFAFVSRGGQSS